MKLKWKFPFEIIGKLSCSPEEAWRMFGFRMKPGARGVVLQRRGGGVVIRNLMPRYKPRTKGIVVREKKFRVLTRLGSEHLGDLVRPIWDKLAEGKRYSGYNLFIGVNMRLLGEPPDWRNLRVSDGNVELPVVDWWSYREGWLRVRLKDMDGKEVGICALDRGSLRLYHFGIILPELIRERPHKKVEGIRVRVGLRSPFIYVYFKEGSCYSESVRLRKIRG